MKASGLCPPLMPPPSIVNFVSFRLASSSSVKWVDCFGGTVAVWYTPRHSSGRPNPTPFANSSGGSNFSHQSIAVMMPPSHGLWMTMTRPRQRPRTHARTFPLAVQRTKTQDYINEPRRRGEWCPGQPRVDQYVHYRLVLETLGQPLNTFKPTWHCAR